MYIFLVFSATLLYATTQSVADDDQPVSYRLLEHQQPQKYTLDLEFKKDVFEGTSTEFTGILTINFLVKRSVEYIQFHAPVNIKSMEFLDNDTYPVPIESESYDPVTFIYTITPTEKLNYTHDYTLNIEYTSDLRTNDMIGVYRGSYTENDGTVEYFIATHFQPIYARFAFPCFDEPKMKASFEISITYPKGLTAMGNAIEDGDPVEVNDDYEKITFKETPVMSTYLVGFILSKLTCSQGDSLINDIPYRVCSKEEFKDKRSVALDLGPLFIERMENITGISYSNNSLGKLDQVAVPGYTAKYMENWGLITYRKSSLLWDSTESSLAYRNVVMDIYLELAHSWFGNLESVEWWDYTYLNLGFSRFYQYHAAAEIEKLEHWELDKQFAVDQLQPSLVKDAFSSVSELSYHVDKPEEILTKFSEFAYSKGASIIRMAQHVIGPENFQKSVDYFLPTYIGSNIMPVYVWNKLEIFCPREVLPHSKNLNGVMEGWTESAGYPLVTVSAKGNNIILTQERFLYSGETDFTEWCVPITYTVSSDFDKFLNTTTTAWLLPETSHTMYDILEENDWIIVNNQQVGYYRVNYDDVLWQNISQLLSTNHTSIHVLNRAQIVDDLLNLARAKVLNYSYAFDIIRYLENEEDYYPWKSALTNFEFLLTQVSTTSGLGVEIGTMIVLLLQNVYKSLSFEHIDPEDQVQILKLLTVTNTYCKLGDGECILNMKELFESYKAGNSIDTNLRGVVFCNALRWSVVMDHNDVSLEWQLMWESLQLQTLESERETLIAALGCARNSTVLKNYLDQSVDSSSGLTLEELPKVWSAVYTSNPEGVDVAFDYLYQNFDKVSAYYPNAIALLTAVVERFTEEDQLAKLEEFIALGSLEPSDRVTAQLALESAKERMEWVESVKDDLIAYFNITETITTEEVETTADGGANKIKTTLFKLIYIITLSKLALQFL